MKNRVCIYELDQNLYLAILALGILSTEGKWLILDITCEILLKKNIIEIVDTRTKTALWRVYPIFWFA